MTKNKIVLIGALVLIVVAVGGYLVIGRNSGSSVDPSQLVSDPSLIELAPLSMDFGKVLYGDGVVTKEYEVKNKSDKILSLRKIVTSCMCTRASVSLNGKNTSFYAMEMSGDKNPRISFDIPGGQTAKLVVKFDPAAHGPAGVGKFDRIVWLTFADPIGVKQVAFNGEVAIK